MSKNKSFITLIITLLFFLITADSFAKDIKITIFHMNDIHAHIKNFAKVANIVKEERKISENVYFFNIGDNFSGNPSFAPKYWYGFGRTYFLNFAFSF